MLVFALLVFGTMKWIWPLILGAMEERSRKIAQGLAAAERGEQQLSEARDQADAIIRAARERARRSPRPRPTGVCRRGRRHCRWRPRSSGTRASRRCSAIRT